MDINTVVLNVIMFCAGGLIAPLFIGKGEKAGKEAKTISEKAIQRIEDPEFKAAMLGFCVQIEKEMSSSDGKAKFEKWLTISCQALSEAIPGSIDDIIINNVLRPYLQGVYNGYVKKQ